MARDTVSDILERLVASRQATRLLINDLSEEEAQHRQWSGAWSIKDHVAHLAAVEEMVIVFAQRMLVEDGPTADPYDVDAWNARELASRANLSWPGILAELDAAREHLLSLIKKIPEPALNCTASHPVWGSPITLSSVLRVPYRHERGHRDEIEALCSNLR